MLYNKYTNELWGIELVIIQATILVIGLDQLPKYPFSFPVIHQGAKYLHSLVSRKPHLIIDAKPKPTAKPTKAPLAAL